MAQEMWCLRRYDGSGNMMAQEIWWLRRCGGSGDVVAQEIRWLIEAHRLLGQRSQVRIRHPHNDPVALHAGSMCIV